MTNSEIILKTYTDATLSKIRTYIGFAIKANKAVFGIDNLEKVKKPLPLILVDKKIGGDTSKRLTRLGLAVVKVDNLCDICTKQGVKLLGIKEPNLAKAIKEELKV